MHALQVRSQVQTPVPKKKNKQKTKNPTTKKVKMLNSSGTVDILNKAGTLKKKLAVLSP
jgi:hypothetical protein